MNREAFSHVSRPSGRARKKVKQKSVAIMVLWITRSCLKTWSHMKKLIHQLSMGVHGIPFHKNPTTKGERLAENQFALEARLLKRDVLGIN